MRPYVAVSDPPETTDPLHAASTHTRQPGAAPGRPSPCLPSVKFRPPRCVLLASFRAVACSPYIGSACLVRRTSARFQSLAKKHNQAAYRFQARACKLPCLSSSRWAPRFPGRHRRGPLQLAHTVPVRLSVGCCSLECARTAGGDIVGIAPPLG